MPELPEVETVRRSLLPHLVGREICRVRVVEPRLRYPVRARDLTALAVGRRVEDVTRRAKYLFVRLEGQVSLVLHLGMTGKLLVVPQAEPDSRHTHVVFDLVDGKSLRFRDPRRFGSVEVLTAKDLEGDQRFQRLGVEPLSRACSGRYLFERSRRLRRPVKSFLMDSDQVVGVGNIYASETLFLAGVHPLRAAGRMSLASWERVCESMKRVLRGAIGKGGTTFRDFRNVTGDEGAFQTKLRVYDREGMCCGRCGRVIRRRVISGRSTFYCPGCQR